MKTATAHSAKESVSEAVREIKRSFQGLDPTMVVFFASSIYDPGRLSRAMADAFPGAAVFGCTSAGEIVTGRMLKKSLVAMAFGAETVADVAIGVMKGLNGDGAATGVSEAFRGFERHYGARMADMDFSRYVGLILVDGLSVAEERIMDRIGDLTNVLFVGGSAGDDLKFESTHVCVHGEAYRDAAVLALLKPSVGFEIVKTQSFVATGTCLVATEVNEADREVISFNGRPAAEAYAEALKTTVEDAPNHFMSHPVGLLAGDEIFVRSPQRIRDGKMVFYCNVPEGTELRVLNSTDIIADTKAAIDEKIGAGTVAGLINFHCILRTLELEKNELTGAYGKVFSGIPTVGLSTYGEEYLGHINQTSTMLLLR